MKIGSDRVPVNVHVTYAFAFLAVIDWMAWHGMAFSDAMAMAM